MIKALVINTEQGKVRKSHYEALEKIGVKVRVVNMTGLPWLSACNSVLAKEPPNSWVLLIHPRAKFYPESIAQLLYTLNHLPKRYQPVRLIGPLTNHSTGMQQRNFKELPRMGQKKNLLPVGYLNPYLLLVRTPFQFNTVDETIGYLELWKQGETMLVDEGAVADLPAAPNKSLADILKKEEVRIAGLMRVKLPSPQEHKEVAIFLRSVESLVRACDKAFIFIDGEENATKKLVEGLGNIEFLREPNLKTEEEQREYLIRCAYDQGYNWALSLDADEIFEENVNTLRRYLSRLSPFTCSLFLRVLNLYDSPNRYRVDGVFGNHGTLRIFRLSNAKIRAYNPQIHTGSALFYPPEYRAFSCYRILHYGFMNREWREEKYKRYKELDPNPIPEIAGYDNYEWLLDDEQIVLKPLTPRKTCTLAQIVKNEEEYLGEFYGSLAPVFDYIKVLDTGSTDKTPKLLEHFADEWERVEFDEFPGFDVLRNRVIEGVKTDFICFLDPDERLENTLQFLKTFDHPVEYAYLFYVKNVLKDGRVSLTETVRLWPSSWGLKFDGYIHETLDKSIVEKGKRVVRHPVKILHFGYLKPQMPQKVLRYEQLVKEGLRRNPNDEKLWWALALYEIERDNEWKAIEYLRKAIAINPDFALAYKELALAHMDEALNALANAIRLYPPEHVFHKQAKQLYEDLRSVRPPKIRTFTQEGNPKN